MEYNKPIAEMTIGGKYQGFYILKTAASRMSVNGKPFLAATLSDITGDMDTKVWDYSGPVGQADEGSVIKVQGTVSEYKSRPQFTVEKIRLRTPEDAVDLSRLVPVAPINQDEYYRKITSLVDSMTDADYATVCLAMLERHGRELQTIPAAKSVHHGFIHGLLMHTANMMCMADFLAGLYSSVIDRSLLLAGTLLHDMAKSREFNFSDLGLVTDYSVPGQLLGHLYMGAREVEEVARELNIPEEKSVLLQHMILSHHGEPEYGAAVRPLCAEAELLSHIDMIDSRMEIFRENLDSAEPGGFTARIFSMERRLYRHT